MSAKNNRTWTPVFLLVGILLFAYLATQTSFEPIIQSLRDVGSGIFLFFIIAPFWFAASAFSLTSLTDYRIGFWTAYYAQFVGEAYNATVPLAGLAGEPFKIKQLTQHLPLADATQAIVRDRIVHAISGPIYASFTLAIATCLTPLSNATRVSLLTLALAVFFQAVVPLGILFSKLPTRFSSFLVERISFFRPLVGWEQIGLKRLVVALSAKLVARSVNMIEIWIGLKLLGLTGSAAQVLMVAAFITLSAIFFFVIPQGLGITEAGITGAFTFLGLPAPIALSFGLMRRARVLFWALLGLAVHLPVVFVVRLVRPAQAVAE